MVILVLVLVGVILGSTAVVGVAHNRPRPNGHLLGRTVDLAEVEVGLLNTPRLAEGAEPVAVEVVVEEVLNGG